MIRDNTSPRHVPARILQVADIPRTRSGKITELAVRDVVHGREVKNVGALANPEALEHSVTGRSWNLRNNAGERRLPMPQPGKVCVVAGVGPATAPR